MCHSENLIRSKTETSEGAFECGSSERAVDSKFVKKLYRSLADEGVGQSTVLEVKRDLVRTFNQAIQPYRRVPFNLGNPFKLTVPSPPRREAIALTPEQAKAALKE